MCECVSVCESESEREEIRMRDKSGVCKTMLCCVWWSVDAANVDSRARFTLTSEADSTTRHDTTRHDASEETLSPSSPVNNTLYEHSRKSRRTACRAGGDALSLAVRSIVPHHHTRVGIANLLSNRQG